jgi:hypothetical protein
VYDYAAGKADWLAAGLSTIKADGIEPRALDVADRDPAICRPDDLVSEVVDLAAGTSLVVVNEGRIVLGRLRAATLDTDGAARVEAIMEPGPSTVRAHEPLAPLLERMTRRSVDEVIVTSPEGLLLGVVRSAPQAR